MISWHDRPWTSRRFGSRPMNGGPMYRYFMHFSDKYSINTIRKNTVSQELFLIRQGDNATGDFNPAQSARRDGRETGIMYQDDAEQ
jgi:hypothetical protein